MLTVTSAYRCALWQHNSTMYEDAVAAGDLRPLDLSQSALSVVGRKRHDVDSLTTVKRLSAVLATAQRKKDKRQRAVAQPGDDDDDDEEAPSSVPLWLKDTPPHTSVMQIKVANPVAPNIIGHTHFAVRCSSLDKRGRRLDALGGLVDVGGKSLPKAPAWPACVSCMQLFDLDVSAHPRVCADRRPSQLNAGRCVSCSGGSAFDATFMRLYAACCARADDCVDRKYEIFNASASSCVVVNGSKIDADDWYLLQNDDVIEFRERSVLSDEVTCLFADSYQARREGHSVELEEARIAKAARMRTVLFSHLRDADWSDDEIKAFVSHSGFAKPSDYADVLIAAQRKLDATNVADLDVVVVPRTEFPDLSIILASRKGWTQKDANIQYVFRYAPDPDPPATMAELGQVAVPLDGTLAEDRKRAAKRPAASAIESEEDEHDDKRARAEPSSRTHRQVFAFTRQPSRQTASMWYVSAMREVVRKQIQLRNPHAANTLDNAMRQCASRWAQLSLADRRPYLDMQALGGDKHWLLRSNSDEEEQQWYVFLFSNQTRMTLEAAKGAVTKAEVRKACLAEWAVDSMQDPLKYKEHSQSFAAAAAAAASPAAAAAPAPAAAAAASPAAAAAASPAGPAAALAPIPIVFPDASVFSYDDGFDFDVPDFGNEFDFVPPSFEGMGDFLKPKAKYKYIDDGDHDDSNDDDDDDGEDDDASAAATAYSSPAAARMAAAEASEDAFVPPSRKTAAAAAAASGPVAGLRETADAACLPAAAFSSSAALLLASGGQTDEAKQSVLEQFECSICSDYMVRTHRLSCDHTFCYACIKLVSEQPGAVGRSCPICSQETVSSMRPAASTDTLVEVMVRTFGSDSERLAWGARVRKSNDSRRPPPLMAVARPAAAAAAAAAIDMSDEDPPDKSAEDYPRVVKNGKLRDLEYTACGGCSGTIFKGDPIVAIEMHPGITSRMHPACYDRQ